MGRRYRHSATSQGWQASRSAGVGLFAGGAQRTGSVMRRSSSRWPSSAVVDTGEVQKPVRCSAANSQSPLRSPVKIRPVRLPPCAAGARPTTATDASRGPQPVTGRPQYSWSA